MGAAPAKREETVVVHRRRLRPLRWLVAALMVVAVLLLLAIGGVQLVLWSDMPRARLVQELQMETGLRIEAGSSQTVWAGVTELRDVSVALPLEDEAFLRVPVLRIRHTPLLGLVIGPFEVHEATIEGPSLRLRRDELGRWNVMRALEIVQARQAHATPTGEMPPLPRIELSAGVINVLGANGEAVEAPLHFEGDPDGPLAWAFTLALGDALKASGRLAPRGEWQHQVDVSFGEDQALFRALVPEQALPLRGEAEWRGGLENGEFTGRLRLARFQMGELGAIGNAGVVSSNGRLTLRPRDVRVGSTERSELQGRVVSGAMTLEGSVAKMHRLRIESSGTIVNVDGEWDMEREAGEVVASWTGTAMGPVLGHEGDIRLEAKLPEVGAASLRADVRSIGQTGQGMWETEVHLSVRGGSWEQMIGEMTAKQLVWRDEQGTIELDGAMARVETAWPMVHLKRVVIPGAERSRVNASLDAVAMTWQVEAEASQWDVPRVRGGALDLLVRAEGDAERIRVPEMRVAGLNFSARASGDYDLRQEVPLRAAARVSYRMPGDERGRPEGIQLQAEAGAWLAHVEVSGDLEPLDVRMNGELLGRDVQVGDALVGHVTIPFTGHARPDAAEFASGRFDLLGGAWQVQGRYVDRERALALQLEAELVPLQSLAQIADIGVQMPGTAGARVQVLVPGLDLDALEIRGEFSVADVDRPGLVVERGRGEVMTRHGVLTLRDLELVAGDAQLTGSLEYNLRQREEIRLDVEMRAWPLSYEGVPVTGLVDGRARVDVRLEDLMLRGRVDASADVAHQGMPLGRLSTLSVLDGRRVDVRRLRGDVCGGTLEGHGVVVMDDLLRSTGVLSLDAVDVAELLLCFGIEDEIEGTMGAEIRLGPAADPRALEPLALTVDITSADAMFRTISVGDARIRAFFGPGRSVLDRSTFGIAGGVLTLSSRTSLHAEERFFHVQSTVDGIDIDQVYRAFEPEGGELAGRVSGQAAFGGYVEAPHRLFGEARLALVDSDLANLPVISTLYNLLNLRIGTQQPHGRGEARVRLEGDALELHRLQYFNRGADIGASLRIENVRMGGESPISGVAAGTMRPLRDITIPFLDVDRMLGALQRGAASVEISGTLEDREVRVVPFAEIAGRFLRILGAGD